MIKLSWWVDFRFSHTRYRRRSPDNSRKGAQAYEATLRQRLARGETIDRVISERPLEHLFGRYAEHWFEDYVVPNNKFSEQRTKRYILSATLIPFFGSTSVDKISTHLIEQYKAKCAKQGVANKTLKNRLTVLSKCLTCAYEWLKLDGTPPKIKWPKCPPPQTDYLSLQESERLLAHAGGLMHDMILIALRTGMRQGEIKGLQWPAIDWESHSLTVRHSRCDYAKALVSPKSNRERHIPMDADVFEALHKRKKTSGYVFNDVRGKPFDCKTILRELAGVCKTAGLRRVTWHVLRHTFATHLAMRGVPLNVVQTLLGHTSISTTMRYAHVAPSALRTAIELLNPASMTHASFGQPVGNPWMRADRKQLAEQSNA